MEGTYRLVAHYLNEASVAGDWFEVTANEVESLKVLAGQVQDVASLEQFSFKQNGNVVGINLPNVTHIVLEKCVS
jgi:hypothetical protein